MLSPDNDPLAGYYVDEPQTAQNQEVDPLAGYYVDPATEEKEEPYRDVVSENLRAQGYEPEFSEELERAGEAGIAEAYRGLLSGASLGITENIPGLKPGEGFSAKTGEFIGSVLPIDFLATQIGKPLLNVAKKSPYFKRTVQALANITGIGLAGGTYEAGQKITKEHELPSVNEVLEHGFEWAALDAILRAGGKAGSFAVELAKTARKTKKPEFKLVNEVYTELKQQGIDVGKDKRAGAKALSILEDISKEKPTKGEVRKVSEKQFKEMDNSLDQLSEPILPEAKEPNLNVNNAVENIENAEVRAKIDSVGRRAVDDADLGKDIQKSVNDAREASKAEYKPFYDEVEEGSRFITTTPKETAKVSGELIKGLEELRTSPTGYKTVIKTIEDVLQDAGYQIQRSKSGEIESIIQSTEVPLSKMLELGRRLNEVVDYDVLEFSIKDRLKPVVRAVKSDIRSALEGADEDLLAAFELAEKAYAMRASKFGRESIRKIRGTQALENIPKQLESATALNDLRAVLSGKEMQNVERDILEKMNRMTEVKAQDFLRKIKSGLSKESQNIADDIIKSKKPLSKQSLQSRRQRLHEAVDADLTIAMNTGKRPKKTLDLWQNPRGQKLVREALETNPQKKELLEYLQKQTLQDMAKTIIKDGTIDTKVLSEMMDNTAIRNNLRDLGGEEAVNFFNQLAHRAENLKKNAQELVTETLGTQKGVKKVKEVSTGEKGQQILKRMAEADYPLAAKVQKGLDFLGFTGKGVFSLFTLMKFGILKAALVPLATTILKRMTTSNRVRKAFIEASKKQTDPVAFIAAMEELSRAIDEED